MTLILTSATGMLVVIGIPVWSMGVFGIFCAALAGTGLLRRSVWMIAAGSALGVLDLASSALLGIAARQFLQAGVSAGCLVLYVCSLILIRRAWWRE